MRCYRWLLVLCMALALVPAVSRAGDDDDDDGDCEPSNEWLVDWYTMAAGGGLSEDCEFVIEGTAGQTGVEFTSMGDGYVFLAGFWAPDFQSDHDDDDDDDRMAPAGGDGQTAMLDATGGAIGAPGEAPILEFALSPVSPNPSVGMARISWAVPVQSRVQLTVHDVQGRLVAQLADEEYRPGRHQITWNSARAGVSPGMYFVRLQSPERMFVRRVVVAR